MSGSIGDRRFDSEPDSLGGETGLRQEFVQGAFEESADAAECVGVTRGNDQLALLESRTLESLEPKFVSVDSDPLGERRAKLINPAFAMLFVSLRRHARSVSQEIDKWFRSAKPISESF